ncbi:MAG: PEP-CTERM sorting domain-containing protein [Verrucomicrobiaceae bacterium]
MTMANNNLRKGLFTKAMILSLPLFAVTTATGAVIYSEDFTGQQGKGAVGPTPTIDVSGVDWSIDVSGANLTATSDFFEVRSDESFTGRDLDGPAIWSSPVITTIPGDILDFSLLAAGSAAIEFEEADDYVITYLVDGVPTALTDLIPADDTFNAGTISEIGITAGSSFQLQVLMNMNAGAEILSFDDIVVNAIPEPSSIALLGLAGLSILRRRR